MPRNRAEDVNEVFDALKHHLRRDIILYFERQEPSVTTLSELVTHLDREHPAVDRDTLETALVHNHLPKLDTLGWVAFDSEQHRVFYYGNDQAKSILAAVLDIFEN